MCVHLQGLCCGLNGLDEPASPRLLTVCAGQMFRPVVSFLAPVVSVLARVVSLLTRVVPVLVVSLGRVLPRFLTVSLLTVVSVFTVVSVRTMVVSSTCRLVTRVSAVVAVDSCSLF